MEVESGNRQNRVPFEPGDRARSFTDATIGIQEELPVTLSLAEQESLTFVKWRQHLQSEGFSGPQARRLTFLRWLHLHGRLTE